MSTGTPFLDTPLVEGGPTPLEFQRTLNRRYADFVDSFGAQPTTKSLWVFVMDGEGGFYWPEPMTHPGGKLEGRTVWVANVPYRIGWMRDPSTAVLVR